MKVSNTSERLKEIMEKKGMRQIDLYNKVQPICKKYGFNLNRSDISQYLSGKVEPSQKKLTALGEALGVDESWLMGMEVPMRSDAANLYKSLDTANELANNTKLLELFTICKDMSDDEINTVIQFAKFTSSNK